jgi:glycosyltransferase involved in cell wall biosynthesis
MPKVSVIIPAYNQAQFIAEAIQSVLNQTFQDFEIIVIDDGSTDNTPEIVSAFPVKYFCQENQRLPAARNRGVEISCGEYIAFLDSDDVLLEKAIEKGVEALDTCPEAGFSYGRAYLMDEKGRILGLRKAGSKRSCLRQGIDEIKDFLVSGNHILPCTVMTRRDCLERVGPFDPAFNSGSEDIDLWVRLAKRYTVAYIAEPLAKYRVHSSSISHSRQVTEIEGSNSRILEGVFSDTELGPIFAPRRVYFYSRLYFRLASYAYASGDMKTARSYLFRTRRIYPKGFLKSLWLPWILCFGKTWIPSPVLSLAHSIKRRTAMIASWRGAN